LSVAHPGWRRQKQRYVRLDEVAAHVAAVDENRPAAIEGRKNRLQSLF